MLLIAHACIAYGLHLGWLHASRRACMRLCRLSAILVLVRLWSGCGSRGQSASETAKGMLPPRPPPLHTPTPTPSTCGRATQQVPHTCTIHPNTHPCNMESQAWPYAFELALVTILAVQLGVSYEQPVEIWKYYTFITNGSLAVFALVSTWGGGPAMLRPADGPWGQAWVRACAQAFAGLKGCTPGTPSPFGVAAQALQTRALIAALIALQLAVYACERIKERLETKQGRNRYCFACTKNLPLGPDPSPCNAAVNGFRNAIYAAVRAGVCARVGGKPCPDPQRRVPDDRRLCGGIRHQHAPLLGVCARGAGGGGVEAVSREMEEGGGGGDRAVA